jgi:hypothetical protein
VGPKGPTHIHTNPALSQTTITHHNTTQVGGVPLKDVLRISLLDDLTFELAAADRRRRVFVAANQDERDLWVGYISEGMKVRVSPYLYMWWWLCGVFLWMGLGLHTPHADVPRSIYTYKQSTAHSID